MLLAPTGLARHAFVPTASVSKRRAPTRLGLTRPASAACHHTSMKILNLIHVMVAQAFYKWALAEINPLHPDVPRIMLRRHELEEKARRIFA